MLGERGWGGGGWLRLYSKELVISFLCHFISSAGRFHISFNSIQFIAIKIQQNTKHKAYMYKSFVDSILQNKID